MSDKVAQDKIGRLTADLAARRIGRRAFMEKAVARISAWIRSKCAGASGGA
jgi:hypothetical protein